MLHELLLALSGHTSPLLDDTKSHGLTESLSPSEKALLRSLACLGSLQAKLRTRCAIISSSHASTICRAVCASVVSSHLSAFNAKVVEVEASILRNDAEYVGAYDIVPLTAIVAAFDGWDRVLRWLERFVGSIIPNGAAVTASKPIITGAQMIDYLKDEIHTGYPEIEQLASDLLNVAEAAWVRQLTPWLLYGQLPSYGTEDFFIQLSVASHEQINAESFVVVHSLLPYFLDLDTANSILFIGRSLQHIQRGHAKLSATAAADLESARAVVLQENMDLVERLELPLTSFTLAKTVANMRSSLSRKALQKLLPFSDVLRLLDVLRQFFLLERGEFAVALIGAADECLAGRHLKTGSHKDRARLGGMMIKDGEVNSVLSRTWASLIALQDVNDDEEDEDLEYAREVVELSIRKQAEDSRLMPATTPVSRLDSQASLFDDVLLATPTTFTLILSAPLDIFLTEHDVQDYSLIHSYLLGIRRAHLHLADLWKLSTLRRVHPAPRLQPRYDAASSKAVRTRANARSLRMRSVWAAISNARFFFAQMNDYLQGEVVESCTRTLQQWISPAEQRNASRSRPNTSSGSQSAPSKARRGPVAQIAAHNVVGDVQAPEDELRNDLDRLDPQRKDEPRHDPEAIATAHRSYLSQMKDSLLLNETRFVTSMRNLMTRADHAVALTQRLAVVIQITQLGEQTPTGEQTSHAKEEHQLMKSLESVTKSIKSSLDDLLRTLRDLDDRRRLGVLPSQQAAAAAQADLLRSQVGIDRGGFMPWQGPGLSRLLLRLESGTVNDDMNV